MSGSKRPALIEAKRRRKVVVERLDDEGVQNARAALDRARRSKRGVLVAERNLLRECELAQQHEDFRVRSAALLWLAQSGAPGGERVMCRAIREDTHANVVLEGMAGVVRYAMDREIALDTETRRALRELALDQRNHGLIRDFAMLALLRDPNRSTKQMLIEVANNDSDEWVRLQANRALLRYGYAPAKRCVLQHVRRHPDHVGYADDLWWSRSNFHMKPAEERELREMMENYHEQFRRRLYDRRWSIGKRVAAVRWLIWLADDFEFPPEDVDQAKRVVKMCDEYERPDLEAMLKDFEAKQRGRKKKAH